MAEKVKKRWCLPPCPNYDVERLESWLQDMAKEGWMLDGNDIWWFGLFPFKKAPPQTVRYRLEPKPKRHSNFTNAPDEEEEELYKAYGWEFVRLYAWFYIYRTDDPEARELNTDPKVQAAALNAVKRNAGPSLLFQLYLVAYWFFRIRNEGTRILVSLDWSFLPLFVILLVTALIINCRQFLHIRRLRKQLKENIPLDHNKPWRKTAQGHRIRDIAWSAFSILFTVSLCTSCTSAMAQSYEHTPTSEFPGDPPFITCADLGSFTEDGFLDYNTYNAYSTTLAPTIIEWKEFGEIRTEDGRTVDGSLSIDYYETVSPTLARGLVDDFLYHYQKYDDFEIIDAPDIDADYVAAFHFIFPTVLIQQDNIFICATVGLEYREDYLLEEWAQLMADYLNK